MKIAYCMNILKIIFRYLVFLMGMEVNYNFIKFYLGEYVSLYVAERFAT
jgi:hypothetical protein